MDKPLIFISSSQTEAHRSIPEQVRKEVEGTSRFKAFFAPEVRSAAGATEEIFAALRDCSGLIAFFHGRGLVDEAGRSFHRSSVWVNQEIAVLAYRRFERGEQLPVLAFQETLTPRVEWEGALQMTMFNPIPLTDASAVIARVKRWLDEADFAYHGDSGNEVFEAKWTRLTPETKKVVRALFDEGGGPVSETLVRIRLRAAYISDKNEAARAVVKGKQQFEETGLVDVEYPGQGQCRLTLNRVWLGRLRHRLQQLA
jgi:uncharacterized protein YqgV (UPF0045/DUF77 family)